MKITKYNNVKNISGNKLKELRKDAQMSQQDLAEKLQLEGIDLTSKEISKIETNIWMDLDGIREYNPDYLKDYYKEDEDESGSTEEEA
jgi:transcriptional regulator with XRE-family HTH domain